MTTPVSKTKVTSRMQSANSSRSKMESETLPLICDVKPFMASTMSQLIRGIIWGYTAASACNQSCSQAKVQLHMSCTWRQSASVHSRAGGSRQQNCPIFYWQIMILSDQRTNFSSRWSWHHATFEDERKLIWFWLCAWPSLQHLTRMPGTTRIRRFSLAINLLLGLTIGIQT